MSHLDQLNAYQEAIIDLVNVERWNEAGELLAEFRYHVTNRHKGFVGIGTREEVYIYTLSDPRIEGVFFYVGQTIEPAARWLQHIGTEGKNEKYRWARYLVWLGRVPRLKVRIITTWLEANDLEKKTILSLLDEGHPLTNEALRNGTISKHLNPKTWKLYYPSLVQATGAELRDDRFLNQYWRSEYLKLVVSE